MRIEDGEIHEVTSTEISNSYDDKQGSNYSLQDISDMTSGNKP